MHSAPQSMAPPPIHLMVELNARILDDLSEALTEISHIKGAESLLEDVEENLDFLWRQILAASDLNILAHLRAVNVWQALNALADEVREVRQRLVGIVDNGGVIPPDSPYQTYLQEAGDRLDEKRWEWNEAAKATSGVGRAELYWLMDETGFMA